MKSIFSSLCVGVALGFATRSALAIDPPHTTASLCNSCHLLHSAPGGNLTAVSGNANLCMSCHQTGGSASTKPFANSAQALPWTGLPTGTNATGTSHRWDANAAGHIIFLGGATTPSSGTVMPSGVYTGIYAKTFTLTITTAGDIGTARFNWNATSPGGGAGTNILTAASVALSEGAFVSFQNATNPSFHLNDKWNIFVRTGLRNPTNATMLLHMTNGVAFCSACHDEHSQARTPFDPGAAPFTGPGSGTNRHFMRVDNDFNQMCMDCHNSRNVTNALAGSHPVGIVCPADAKHKSPALLPLEKTTTNLGCLTCHQVHFSPGNNGMTLRSSNTVSLCVDCHTLANTATPAAHFVTSDTHTLWPGGQYGSLLPARTDTALQGSCLNCHMVHGWPDGTNTAVTYPHLLADREENFCFTCHDANGPAVKRVKDDFAKTYHHPVANSEQVAGRTVECSDCHNAHQTIAGGYVYTNTATSARNQVSNPLLGVSGIAVDYNGLGNFDAPAP